MDELGIDPRTSRMLSERSTTELHALVMLARKDLQRCPARIVLKTSTHR